jgi:phosphate uptake regulator
MVLQAEKSHLEEDVLRIRQIAHANEQAALDAFKSRDLLEAALSKATEDKNKIQRRWSSLYQQYTEAIKNDQETNDWDSAVLPAGAVGVLIQAGGIRSTDSD